VEAIGAFCKTFGVESFLDIPARGNVDMESAMQSIPLDLVCVPMVAAVVPAKDYVISSK
jgi:hypothetical protein